MSDDRKIAGIGRNLAQALMHYARERDGVSKGEIARLQTELCVAVRQEQSEESNVKATDPNQGS